jgi:hypothetical protein
MGKIILEHIVNYTALLAPPFATKSTAFTMLSKKTLAVKMWNQSLMPKPHFNDQLS